MNDKSDFVLPRRQRYMVIGASLLALFLAALDALIIAAAMPSVVTDLGGLHLYSWVYSAYFLSRAVSLPIFGKLADLYRTRNLFITGVGIFMVSSAAAGCAWNMTSLIVFRVFQGIGSGGIFALVYTVLVDVSIPEKRGRTLSLASSTWGIASVLGPTLGGLIVTFFSWRWVFFINIPLGIASIWGIGAYLVDVRQKNKSVSLDVWGVMAMATTILAFLFLMMTGGRDYPWVSPPAATLLLLTFLGGAAFIWVERKAKDPILSIAFFKNRSFSTGNSAIFLCCFTVFSLFAFVPLLMQGAQEKTPMQVGMTMLSLSLGWSLGSMSLGQVIDRMGKKTCAVMGSVILIFGCLLTLGFSAKSTMVYMTATLFVTGLGTGFVSLSTLLVVQSGLDLRDLGVATSSNQLARTVGGTFGVGISGGLIAGRIADLKGALKAAGAGNGAGLSLEDNRLGDLSRLFDPDVQATLPSELKAVARESLVQGAGDIFLMVTLTAILCLVVCLFLPVKASKT